LEVASASGDQIELASVAASLGFVHNELGDHEEAVIWAVRARDLFLELVPDERDTAVDSNRDTLVRLAYLKREQGELGAARGHYLAALDVYDDLGFAKADEVRSSLSGLGLVERPVPPQ
jgi:tetratricopeptide (TPR) repeat protein